MERPEQHITETKSQRIFERIVPFEWVCREIKPDYGVDYLVEIFENNKSTGKTFFVQLKGSTQNIENNTFEKQFTTDNLNYYKSLSIPVLIVCVSVTSNQIWGIWANNLIDSKKIKKNQKSISISLGEEYLIDEKVLLKIASDPYLSDKIGISVKAKGDIEKLFNQHIISWIENYYTDTVSTKFNNLPKHLELNYSTDKLNNIQLEIITSTFSKKLEINNISEQESFLYKPLFDNNDINDFNKKALLFIATALAKYDIKSSLEILKKVIVNVDFDSTKDFIFLDPVGLLVLANTKNELESYDKFVLAIIDSKQFDLFFFFDLAYFSLQLPNQKDSRIKNLTRIIEENQDEKLLGTCHYNLGNIYKSELSSNKAIDCYFRARKLQPDYLNRDYWWREIAGLVFSKGHYLWAERMCKKSLKLDINKGVGKKYDRMIIDNPSEHFLVTALIGDCLFFQGKFNEANKAFEQYFKFSSSISQEWILKNMICQELMEGELDNVKLDRKQSLKYCEDAIKASTIEDRINKLKSAVNSNPTNGLAWFNLGVAQDKEGKHKEAMFSFICTSLLQEWDKEAQFNALTISFTSQDIVVMQSLLLFLHQKHGELIINDLSAYIMKKNIPIEGKKHLIAGFKAMIDEVKTMHNTSSKVSGFNV
ncbi:MAG: DUF4365 domain-containing protein [Bacteroidales bacterium]|nr:DUF4365 domain-containing protein [Bacteroidales bacterium]